MFSNWVGTGGDGGDEAGEEQSAAQCVPHDPHPGAICRTYGQQEFSVYKFVPPPTHQYPPSSFFQTICTKDPDKGAQSPPRMSARVRKLLLHAKECVCALNENISFVRFFDQREDRFEGNIYNTPRHKPLMSKSFHSLKPTLQNKSSRCETKNKTQNVKD